MEYKTDFKALSTKSKIQYVWDYYKWRIILPIILVFIVIYLIHNYVTYKEPTLNITMVNSTAEDLYDATPFDSFMETYGYDTKSNPVSLNATYQFPENDSDFTFMTNQALRALNIVIYAGGQDLFFGTGDEFTDFAEDGVLCDLSEILSAETLEKYKDNILYSTASGEVTEYPCAVWITVSDNEWLKSSGYYEGCYFGVFSGGDHADAATEFAQFLLGE